ncbi:hypothetical protein [Mycobacterium shottsii]|uniref:hypothetical protein n=1 Tax=Mycobacterium shottsii TaxID=133549 RepID=UPI00217D02AA|nr:hypothetical protein [Mycobacterium shottsii]
MSPWPPSSPTTASAISRQDLDALRLRLVQPLVQPGPDLIGRVGTAFPLVAYHQRATGDDAGDTGQSKPLPHAAHDDRLSLPMVLGWIQTA